MTEQVTNLADAEALITAAQTHRTVYWFNVPAKLAAKSGIKKLGFIELQAHEEMMCANRCESSQVRLGFELAKEALRRVDDKQLSTADGSTDTFWGGNTPGLSKVRQLVLAAYAHIHTPDEEDSEGFLGSMETEIG